MHNVTSCTPEECVYAELFRVFPLDWLIDLDLEHIQETYTHEDVLLSSKQANRQSLL